MARRREKDLFGFIFSVGGLFVLGFLYSPILRTVFTLLGIIGVVTLIGWLIFRHLAVKKTDPYLVPRPVNAPEIHVLPTEGTPPSSNRSGVAPSASGAFSRELLEALEWRRFEELVRRYFEKSGFEARRTRVGADGGVDIHIFRDGERAPFAYVQCKAWSVYAVGVKPVRELFGVMAADAITLGFFVTSGEFSNEAREFAAGKNLNLVSGRQFLEELAGLSAGDQNEVLRRVTQGDYLTPTCPQCDVKMVRRSGDNGDFWGCVNYARRPSCRRTLKLRKAAEEFGATVG